MRDRAPDPSEPGADAGSGALRRWRRFGRLTPRQRRVMWLLAVAEIFDSYDAALISLALKQIQAGLAIPEAEIGMVAGTVRLGMLAAFAATVMADRWGRRRLLLLTVVGFSLATFATAFARTASEFVWAQMIARAFIGAEVMLGSVVIVEELAARDRGWGIGVLGALGALGHGAAAFAFAFVDVMPFGWRMLYVLGAAPLLVLAWLRRNLPETERFEAHAATREAAGFVRDALRPIGQLFTHYPRRMLVLSLVVFSFDFVHWTVFGFLAKAMQELHHFDASMVSAVVIVGGALGIFGNLFAGELGGRVGWRRVLIALIAVHGVSSFAFYNGGPLAAIVAWIAIVFAATGTGVVIKALGGELFPTSYRSTAAGMRLVVATLGGVSGYQIESLLYPFALASLGDAPGAAQLAHAVAITWMLPVLVLPALLSLWIPETAGRELEDISPERTLP